jgi:hypothetical protein
MFASLSYTSSAVLDATHLYGGTRLWVVGRWFFHRHTAIEIYPSMKEAITVGRLLEAAGILKSHARQQSTKPLIRWRWVVTDD